MRCHPGHDIHHSAFIEVTDEGGGIDPELGADPMLAAVGWSVLQHRSGSLAGSVSEATTADEVAKPTAAAASGSSAAQCSESVHSAR